MFLLNIKEVYVGYSLDELFKVKEALSIEGIKYKYKTVNCSSQRGRRGIIGSYGLDLGYEKLYYVYVKKVDYKQAKYLVQKVLERL